MDLSMTELPELILEMLVHLKRCERAGIKLNLWSGIQELKQILKCIQDRKWFKLKIEKI